MTQLWHALLYKGTVYIQYTVPATFTNLQSSQQKTETEKDLVVQNVCH